MQFAYCLFCFIIDSAYVSIRLGTSASRVGIYQLPVKQRMDFPGSRIDYMCYNFAQTIIGCSIFTLECCCWFALINAHSAIERSAPARLLCLLLTPDCCCCFALASHPVRPLHIHLNPEWFFPLYSSLPCNQNSATWSNPSHFSLYASWTAAPAPSSGLSRGTVPSPSSTSQ